MQWLDLGSAPPTARDKRSDGPRWPVWGVFGWDGMVITSPAFFSLVYLRNGHQRNRLIICMSLLPYHSENTPIRVSVEGGITYVR